MSKSAAQLLYGPVLVFFCVRVCLFFCMSHPTYGYGYMNLSHTRPILTKCDHTKSIQANLNQTKLKQTKKDHTNVTKIQASPLLSVCPILSTYKLTFPNRTHKLDQTKITTINGFGMAKRAAQLLYGPVLALLTFLQLKVKSGLPVHNGPNMGVRWTLG